MLRIYRRTIIICFAVILVTDTSHLAKGNDCPSRILYVSSLFNNEVLRYDMVTGQFIDTFIPAIANGGLDQPHAILDRGTDVLVASEITDSILRYDRDTGAFIDVFIDSTDGLDNPVYMLYGPDGNLYISSQASDEIYRFTPTGQFIDVFIAAGAGGLDGPSGFAFGPDGRVYVASRFSANVIAYNGITGAFDEVLADSADGLGFGNTFGLHVGDNGDIYFASNENIFRYDLDTDSIIATIGTGFPIGIEPGPDGGIFVATGNNLRVVDTSDNSISSPFLTGGVINTLNFFHFSTVIETGLPGDADCDGDADLADFDVLADCLAGPNVAPTPTPPTVLADCLNAFDVDSDNDVDLSDFSTFAVQFTGP